MANVFAVTFAPTLHHYVHGLVHKPAEYNLAQRLHKLRGGYRLGRLVASETIRCYLAVSRWESGMRWVGAMRWERGGEQVGELNAVGGSSALGEG